MIYITEEFCNSHITVVRLIDRGDESEWDEGALKAAIDSPFTSARLSTMMSYFMAVQLLALEEQESFYRGENIYGAPISEWLYSLLLTDKKETNE